jgi:hypothetical protein
MFYTLRKCCFDVILFYAEIVLLFLKISYQLALNKLFHKDVPWEAIYIGWMRRIERCKSDGSRVTEANIFHNSLISELRIRGRSMFRTLTPYKIPVSVIFLAQLPETWMSSQSIYVACAKDRRFRTTVIALPLMRPNSNQFKDEITAFLVNQQIPFEKWDAYDPTSCVPDLIFVPTPFEEQKPPAYQTLALKQISRLAYIPYGIAISGYQDRQFNQVLHNNAWKIFARSDSEKRRFEKHKEIKGSDHVVAIGHPKTDLFFSSKEEDLDLTKIVSEKVLANVKHKIIWAPHFDVRKDSGGWSTFLSYFHSMLDLAKKYPSVLLLVRPHPFLFSTLIDKPILSKPELSELLDKIANIENIGIYRESDYYGLFHHADGLITDTSSFLFEFIPTEKPILYLTNPALQDLNEDGELISGYYQAASAESIESFFRMISANEDPMRDIRIATQSRFLLKPDGNTGKRISDYLGQAYGWSSRTSPARSPLPWPLMRPTPSVMQGPK